MWQALVLCCGFLGEAPDVRCRFVQVHPAAQQGPQRTPGRDCAVVLIQGYCFSLTDAEVRAAGLQSWQQPGSHLVKELSAHADVYSFGYGQNVPVDAVAHAPPLRERIRELKGQGYRHVVLLGHSAGGLIARQLVEEYPDAGVTKVIQVCAPNGGSRCSWLAPFVKKAQRPFVRSLSADARRAAGAGKRVPADVQFLCVVGTRDWVVSCPCQWPADLQNQGIPAVALPLAHDSAMCRPENARRLRELVLRDHPRWTPAQVDAARGSIAGGLPLSGPGPGGSVSAHYPSDWFRPVTVGGRPWSADRIAPGPRRPAEDPSMKRATSWSVQGLTYSALFLCATAATGQGDEPAAVAKGKKLISANAEKICLFAHAYKTYGYKDHEFVGYKKTKDGYYELSYRFTVKGNLKTQTMDMAFFFKETTGAFEFLRVPASTTLYEPFTRVSASYLKQLREEMAKRPQVQNNTELLRVVDKANAKELCEMYLKFAQAEKR
jgi:hypothetical protein